MRKLKLSVLFLLLCSCLIVAGLLACSKTYTVNFYCEGQLYSETTQVQGKKLSLPVSPVKDGYTFGGWYTDSDYVNALTSESYKKQNATFNAYARFTPYWNGVSVKSNFSGDGSAENPYIIRSAEELKGLSVNVNGGENYKDKCFSLTCDLNLGDKEWVPIGGGGNSFRGKFYGNGYTVSHFSVTANYNNVGLFGEVRGALYDLKVKNATVDIAATGVYNAGLAAGYLSGSAKSITADQATLTVKSSYEGNLHAGGLFGYVNEASVIKCASNAEVTAWQSDASVFCGGISGYVNRCTVVACSFLGGCNAKINGSALDLTMYCGGICGCAVESSIGLCLVNSDILSESTYSDIYGHTGGICGNAYGNSQISQCMFYGNVNSFFDGVSYSAGICGWGNDVKLSNNIVFGNVVNNGSGTKETGAVAAYCRSATLSFLYVSDASDITVNGATVVSEIGEVVNDGYLKNRLFVRWYNRFILTKI